MDAVTERLADARERVADAARTARLKRTEAAHAAVDRAREAVARFDERRKALGERLRKARDEFREQHKFDLDWHKREQALKDALERYEEKFLRAYDRRVKKRRKKTGGKR